VVFTLSGRREVGKQGRRDNQAHTVTEAYSSSIAISIRAIFSLAAGFERGRIAEWDWGYHKAVRSLSLFLRAGRFM
jgi:hypothetical protein